MRNEYPRLKPLLFPSSALAAWGEQLSKHRGRAQPAMESVTSARLSSLWILHVGLGYLEMVTGTRGVSRGAGFQFSLKRG